VFFVKTSTSVEPLSATEVAVTAVTVLGERRVKCAFRPRSSADDITNGGTGAKSSNCLIAAAVASEMQDGCSLNVSDAIAYAATAYVRELSQV